MTQINSSLLPNGLKDLLPLEAEKESHIINLLMQEFSNFGYDRVKPPMVEFEESLLANGPGQALARQTFRLMDPISGRMMGVRADTTAQIARIAKSRLADEPRPLRLSYAADVLKVNGSQLRPERQFCQVGCEMIGSQAVQDDVEICLIALNALTKISIQNLSIDLTIPALVDDLFHELKIDEDTQDHLNKLLQKRDRDALAEINTDITKYLVVLLDASGMALEALTYLEESKLPSITVATIKKLKQTYDELSMALTAYGFDINITIDLIERRGFDYQDGISFTLFSNQSRGELGRGGRYRLFDNPDAESATGFTLYMDSILSASKIKPVENKKYVANKTTWEEIKKLQDNGYQVIRQK